MAEIHLTAMTRCGAGGPDMPSKHTALLRDKTWPGGGTVKELVLFIGDGMITVWPADADRIDELGDRLKKLALNLR